MADPDYFSRRPNWVELEPAIRSLLPDEGVRARLIRETHGAINDGFDVAQSAKMLTSSFVNDTHPAKHRSCHDRVREVDWIRVNTP